MFYSVGINALITRIVLYTWQSASPIRDGRSTVAVVGLARPFRRR